MISSINLRPTDVGWTYGLSLGRSLRIASSMCAMAAERKRLKMLRSTSARRVERVDEKHRREQAGAKKRHHPGKRGEQVCGLEIAVNTS